MNSKNFSSLGIGPGTQAIRVYAHVDDLDAGISDLSPGNHLIGAWLKIAIRSWDSARASVTFNRRDEAYAHYRLARKIVVSIIPRCQDYPDFQSIAGTLYQDFQRLDKDLEKQMGYFEAVLKEIIENNRISRVCPRVARLDVVGPWGGAPAGGTPVLKKNMIRSEPSAMAQPSSLLPDPWWPSQIPAEMDGLSHPPFQYMDIVATHTVGLETPKNLCYMNAILQCLSGTIPLARYFLDESYKTALTESSTTKPVGGPAKVFAETVAGLWGRKDIKIWPGTLVFVVRRLTERFKDDSQHDAQEFLEFLLDELDDDLNLNAINSTFKYTEGDKRPSQVGGSPAAASSSQLGRSTPSCSVITDWFQGSLGSSVMCSSCGQARITNDHFMCLSLPIPIGTADELGLDRCLEEFFKTEVLEEEEEEEGEVGGWSCSRCLVGKEATKSLAITKLPHILVVHLKRFTYGEEGGAKIHTLVNSPHRLDLTRYVSIPPTRNEIGRTPPLGHYQLYATCNHAGDLDAGHYTAMVQNLGKGGWNCFDDDTVTSISEEKVVVRLIHD